MGSGLSRHRLAQLVAEGSLVRKGRFLVVDCRWLPAAPDALWRREIHMAICSCSPRRRQEIVVFRRSAGALWGMDGFGPGPVELATDRGSAGHDGAGYGRAGHGSAGHDGEGYGRAGHGRAGHGSAGGPVVHRVRPLLPRDRDRVGGLPITSVTRSLLDLGQVSSTDTIERAVEWALRTGHTSIEAMKAAVSAADHLNLRGSRALRQALSRRPEGEPPTESDAETLFLQLVRRTGLPEPRRQFPVPTAEGTFRVDFAWPDRGLAVEVDGAGVHASRAALQRDLRRQNGIVLSLAAAGVRLLRFTWDDVSSVRYSRQVAVHLREAWTIGHLREAWTIGLDHRPR
ncbi:MAG: endonuclease domain-containing protein [Acidimicrobiales bacterium]